MIILDAYALVALLADEVAAPDVEALLRTGGTGMVIVNLAEALDVTQRVDSISADELRAALDPLLGERIEIVPQFEEASWRAAAIRQDHYGRRARALSLADCFLLAAARDADGIATSDGPVAQAARMLGSDVIPLPNSQGARP